MVAQLSLFLPLTIQLVNELVELGLVSYQVRYSSYLLIININIIIPINIDISTKNIGGKSVKDVALLQ